jgi:hypothetical protein
MNIPDYMPVLSRGPHASPADGACVMEYVSFLAGERWSDSPACTNHALAVTAQRVNDHFSDSERHLLLPLIPRLMGTNEGDPDELYRIIAETAVGYAAPLGNGRDLVSEYATRAAVRLSEGSHATYGALLYATWAVCWSDMDKVAFLSALIDAYDRSVGRSVTPIVTADDLRRCAELTGATR